MARNSGANSVGGFYARRMPRLFLVASTKYVRTRLRNHPQVSGTEIRQFIDEDRNVVSELLLAAYTGTSESEFDDDTEVERFLGSTYGPVIPTATVVATDSATDRIVGASLVCVHEERPLVAHVVVHPHVQGRGIAGDLIAASADALARAGHERLYLAVGGKNLNALRTYARLGFALFAEEAIVDADGVRYETQSCFDTAHSQIDSAVPDLVNAPVFGVGVRRAGSGVEEWPFLNTGPEHVLPGRILAVAVGYRSGSARIEISEPTLEAAIALLAPAGAATFYEHPNLNAWKALHATLQPGDTVIARFDGSG
jgi:GNAT superfamily N-acetyltransferase